MDRSAIEMSIYREFPWQPHGNGSTTVVPSEREGVKTLHFPISQPEQASKATVLSVGLSGTGVHGEL